MALSVVKEALYALALKELCGTSEAFWALNRARG